MQRRSPHGLLLLQSSCHPGACAQVPQVPPWHSSGPGAQLQAWAPKNWNWSLKTGAHAGRTPNPQRSCAALSGVACFLPADKTVLRQLRQRRAIEDLPRPEVNSKIVTQHLCSLWRSGNIHPLATKHVSWQEENGGEVFPSTFYMIPASAR